MSALKVYSLKNCDTCRKSLAWLAEVGASPEIIDVRADGLPCGEVAAIVAGLGWEQAINRRSTTWRGLDDEARSNLNDARAVDLIVEHPTLMKRPVFVLGNVILAGFNDQNRQRLQALL